MAFILLGRRVRVPPGYIAFLKYRRNPLVSMIVRQYLAFVVTVNLDNNRVRAVDPGQIIHAADAELAMQEAKMHILLKRGQQLAVTLIRDLTPNDVPDRFHAAIRELIPDLTV